ncbi:MAG TPA: GNAT family N-acetyltransferase [Candidatus Sulfopaludibacter sp.]|nr:GNAT family N-acetyltransferase [Candidatus Sulfopaludibacter sp.]
MSPSAQIRIRAASLDDLQHVLHHRRSMYEAMGHTDSAMLDEVIRVSEIYFRKALPAGQYRGWLAEAEDGRIAGGGGIVINDWPAHPRESKPLRVWILNMYVEPAWRRRGIARRLMETMIAWCRDEEYVSVSLHASQEGRLLYESMGFMPTNEMRLELR